MAFELKALKVAAVAGAMALLPMAAQAVTVVQANDSVDIKSDDAFIGSVEAHGGAGPFEVEFFTTQDPLDGTADASILVAVAGTFTDLTISWVDSQGASVGTVLASSLVTPIVTSLSTTFTVPSLEQNLVFSWSDSLDGAVFDFSVSAIPLPATGLMLLAGLGGLGLVRRKRKAA